MQPRLLVPGLVLVLLVGGALLPPPLGLPCLAVVVTLVGWLTYLSWPVLDLRARVLRLAVLAMLLVLVVTRF